MLYHFGACFDTDNLIAGGCPDLENSQYSSYYYYCHTLFLVVLSDHFIVPVPIFEIISHTVVPEERYLFATPVVLE